MFQGCGDLVSKTGWVGSIPTVRAIFIYHNFLLYLYMKNINLYATLMELKSSVPAGKSGDYEIEDFSITKEEASFFNINSHGRPVQPGKYKRLYRGKHNWGTVVMSDTQAEKRDHINFVEKAEGNILINGLGLGWVVEALFLKPKVKHATVIEISDDVIKLTGHYLKEKYGNKLTIIKADALEYKLKSGEKYDYVWHDIWDDICADNWDTMTQLHKKYAKRCKFQDSWVRDRIKHLRRINY